MASHTKHIFSKLWLMVIFKTPTDPSATLCWGTIMRHLEPKATYNQKVSPLPQLHSSPSPAAAPKSLPILTNSSFPPHLFSIWKPTICTQKKTISPLIIPWISIGFLPPKSWWPTWEVALNLPSLKVTAPPRNHPPRASVHGAPSELWGSWGEEFW